MNRVPEIFLSEVFGELRIIEENNKFYFCAVDVCKALGYTNITRELNIHCRQDGIKSGRVEVDGIPPHCQVHLGRECIPTHLPLQ